MLSVGRDAYGIDLEAVGSDPSDVIGALRRLGDDSVADELVDALVLDDGNANQDAYRMLLQLKGMEGYHRARERFANFDPGVVDRFTRLPHIMTSIEMTRDDALALLTYDQHNLIYEALLILEYDLRESADQLIDLFSRIDSRYAPYRATIVDILCRFGDRRGLDLVVDDPILFLHLADYLDAPPVRPSPLWFNRVEDGIKLTEWYLQHRDALTWDESVGKFVESQS